MLARKMAGFAAVAIVGIMCVVATEVRADENGIPIALPASALTAPLSCSAPLGDGNSVTIEAVPMGSPAAFPNDVPCPSPAVGTCSEYNYSFTSSNGSTLSKSLLTVSSDVVIYEASPSGSALFNECIADRAPTNGLTACAQREVKFLSHASPLAAKVVVSRAAPRVSTAGSLVGFHSGFCLIQGPGAPGGAFTSVSLTNRERVANGKCDADWNFDTAGHVTGVSTPTPGCFSGVGAFTANSPGGSNEPLQDSGGATLTSGTGTSSCKVFQGRSYCTCTATPCP